MSDTTALKAWQNYESGQRALYHCDLEAAARCYLLAAGLYEKCDTISSSFNSAICRYLGGDYATTVASLDTIRITKLDSSERALYDDLYDICKIRSRDSYWETARSDLKEMRFRGFHKDILSLLNGNPYLVNNGVELAKQFMQSCVALGYEAVAKAFAKDLENLENKTKTRYVEWKSKL